ncbi:MAG: putative phosphatase [Bacteroidetes bacterium]|nr:putative phosphatase [Bacteroidota bacterium]
MATNARMAPRISCVIFDIDGTLSRTNELIFASFNHVAQKYLHRTFQPAEIVAMFGPPEEGALEPIFGSEKLPLIMDELCDFYSVHHHAMARLHDGIEEVLRFLKSKNVRLAVFTGKGKRTTDITLGVLGIAGYFDLIVSGNDVIRHKPDPEGILKVIGAFDLRPQEVLMVGDSLGDIKASRGAGVNMAAVLWDSYDSERVRNAGAEYVFHEVAELLAWLRTHIN